MNYKKKWFVILVIISVFTMTFIGCSDSSSLVGRWVPEQGYAPNDFPETSMELFKDGTGVGDGMTISWKTDKNRLIITSSLFGFAYNYKFSDGKLILTNDDGVNVYYLKK